MTNVLETVAAPAGTPSQFIVTALPGQTGAGIGYTCLSNVTAGAYNGGTCAPLNFYDPQILLFGRIPEAVYDYLYTPNINKTHFDQDTAEFVVNGTLFSLQGGDVKAAAGVSHRHDHILDVPSDAALAGDLYNRASAGITKGSDTVNEAFGELNIPIFKDRPLFQTLELDASGRYTHYKSYGSDFTYHVNGQWAPVREIRFRGNYGTNFRAPNLYEQFVADQTGFFGPSVDPCSGFALSFAPGTPRYDNCLAALTGLVPNPLTFVSTAGPQVTTRGGAGNLKSEHAKTWGFGTVLTAPRRIADFSLAIDYWNITVKDEVAILGSNILNLCYDSADFPNNVYCNLIGGGGTHTGRLPAGNSQQGNLSTLDNPYINVASQQASGIDFDARFATRFFGGRFQTQLQATRNLHQKLQLFPGSGNFDYNGTPGFPGFGAGPKWVGSLDTRFIVNDITFRWGIKYVGKQDAHKILEADGVLNPDGTVATAIGNVAFDLVAEPYWEHGASIQWNWRNVGQFTVGVRNIFNEKPPTISGFPFSDGQYFRIGNSFGGGDYDYYGRSVFVNVTRSF
jgi:outer membrane receptor protein involved in Fe transport